MFKEEIYCSKTQKTSFYINFVSKTYGVCVNSKDIENVEEILREYEKEHKPNFIKTIQNKGGVLYAI